ncbi:MAG: hypothetical protein V4598_15405 [Bdellovibrionota bacterium]
MRRLVFIMMVLFSVNAQAQLDCFFEEDNRVSQTMTAIGNAMANCSLAPGADYWMCRGLTERNCSLVQGEKNYWNCMALSTKNCSLARDPADYWFCRGITEKNCSVATPERHWQCRGITENNCSLVPANQYWFCQALGGTFH